jgi:hypothetical protein
MKDRTNESISSKDLMMSAIVTTQHHRTFNELDRKEKRERKEEESKRNSPLVLLRYRYLVPPT